MAHSDGISLLSIYGDDEDDDDMSPPRSQEGEILAAGRVTYGEELQVVTTGELPETTSHQTVNPTVAESGPVVTGEDITLASEEAKEINPLLTFLPPLPKEKCSEELQVRIESFLNLKRSGKSYNADRRKRKDYCNPDFLLHVVTYQDIDQIGSCFRKDVFDPHGYDKSDFYDALAANLPPTAAIERTDGRSNKKSKWDKVDGLCQPEGRKLYLQYF